MQSRVYNNIDYYILLMQWLLATDINYNIIFNTTKFNKDAYGYIHIYIYIYIYI